MERGLDTEAYVIDVLIEKLKVDLDEEAVLHIEVAEHFFEEAKKYIEVGNAEECVKILAQHYRTSELSEVTKRMEMGRLDPWESSCKTSCTDR